MIVFFNVRKLLLGRVLIFDRSTHDCNKRVNTRNKNNYFDQLIYYISTAVFGQKYLNRNQPPNSSPNSECKARGSVDDYTATQIAVIFFFLQLVFLKWRPKRKILEKNESFQINEVLQKNILGGELRTRC
ncbi:hypothetical protein M3Y96_00682500 [Aphelenchoides besseyi]|nr:hypothetical protein M3Y96_00682500 [Aphelenchoides besseyi]